MQIPIDKSKYEYLLSKALNTGADFAELFFEDRMDNVCKLINSGLKGATSLHIHGVGLHLLKGGNSYYVYSSNTSDNALNELVKMGSLLVEGENKNINIDLKYYNSTPLHGIRINPMDVDIKEKEKVLRKMLEAASSSKYQNHLNFEYYDNVQDVAIINSEGLYATDRRCFSRVRMGGVVSDGNKSSYSFTDFIKPCGFEAFSDYDPYSFARNTVEKRGLELNTETIKGGVMPVVFAAGSSGTFWHEACGHNLESASAFNGPFTGLLNKKMASEKVTLIDDGTIKGLCGSEAIDDEGHPTQNNVLIKNGVMVSHLVDKQGSILLNCECNGSGRRQSYTFAPTSRMHNTYLEVGKDDEEKMIKDVDYGLYVTQLGGGSSGNNFSVAVNYGYLIEKGKLTKPVSGLNLSGTSTEIIQRIDAVGKKQVYEEYGSFCGANSGLVQVTAFCPQFRVSSMNVGGKDE